MLATATAGASHPAVAALLGLGAAGLAGVVVAMAWNVHARQIRLAEQLARRQFIVTAEACAANRTANEGSGPEVALRELKGVNGAGTAPPVVIDGPETVATGEQARYRVRPSGSQKVVSWAAGGGSVSQSPDPAHPDELLMIADRPGNLTITARVREGMTERRATKPVTAVADVTTLAPPFTLRLFLHGWGLVTVAVVIVGFAGALDALGNLTSSDFIALVAPLAALLGMVAVARGTGDAPSRHGNGKDTAGPKPSP
jgi:hypothetical protein